MIQVLQVPTSVTPLSFNEAQYRKQQHRSLGLGKQDHNWRNKCTSRLQVVQVADGLVCIITDMFAFSTLWPKLIVQNSKRTNIFFFIKKMFKHVRAVDSHFLNRTAEFSILSILAYRYMSYKSYYIAWYLLSYRISLPSAGVTGVCFFNLHQPSYFSLRISLLLMVLMVGTRHSI